MNQDRDIENPNELEFIGTENELFNIHRALQNEERIQRNIEFFGEETPRYTYCGYITLVLFVFCLLVALGNVTFHK